MPRIFFVDRDASVKDRLGNELCPHEFDVTIFDSPLDALAGISSAVPDLLVSGIRLPDMSGFDLARAAREIEDGLPVILITDNPTKTVESNASASGIKYVLTRPKDDFGELVSAIRDELSWSCTRDAVRELDEIRMEFFTDLSHKLRTPVTAMKLAIEGLFSQLRGALDPSQKDLADVNRRNIERVVKLIENQLDMLQFMMGESRISRRLFDVNGLVKDIPGRLFGPEHSAGGDPIEIKSIGTAGGPVYVFTDPAPLATIIDCLLGNGPSNVKRALSVEYDPVEQNCRIDVELDFLNADCCSGEHTRPGGGPETECAMNRFDFEYRAYKSLMSQLGGQVSLEKSANNKRVRIVLPRYPEYDRDKDFINPIRVMRAVMEESGRGVTLLRYDFGDGFDKDYPDAGEGGTHGLLTRFEAFMSEGDSVLRGKRPNTFYLALAERSQQELDDVIARLDEGLGDPATRPAVTRMTVENRRQITKVTRDLEPV